MRWLVEGEPRDEDGLTAVVLSAREAAAVHRQLARACDALEGRDGAISPQLRALRSQIATAASAFVRFRAEPEPEPVEQGRRVSGTSALDDLGTLVDVNEAASIVDVSPEFIRRLVASEVLTSVRTSRGHHRIPLDEVEGYRDHRQRTRRSEIS